MNRPNRLILVTCLLIPVFTLFGPSPSIVWRNQHKVASATTPSVKPCFDRWIDGRLPSIQRFGQ
jgi:hypothetical protein